MADECLISKMPQHSFDEIKFNREFKDFIRTVPAEVLGPIMLNKGDIGWRVEMIKRSSIEIPNDLKQAIEEYEREVEKEEIMRMKELPKIMKQQGYEGVKKWWKLNRTDKKVPSKIMVIKAIGKLEEHERIKSANLETYQLMKNAFLEDDSM